MNPAVFHDFPARDACRDHGFTAEDATRAEFFPNCLRVLRVLRGKVVALLPTRQNIG